MRSEPGNGTGLLRTDDRDPVYPARSDAVWRTQVPGTSFIAMHFDTATYQDTDFLWHGIAMPHALTRATLRRRAEYLAGRRCARDGIEALTGEATAPTVDGGRAPKWPAGTTGSITHSNGWAAAMVGLGKDYAGLGIDLERPMDDHEARAVCHDILTPGEMERLAIDRKKHIGRVITLTFSVKESLFKALNPIVCCPFYFQDAEVIYCNETGSITLRLLRDLSNEWRSGKQIKAHFGYHEELLLTIVPLRQGMNVPDSSGEQISHRPMEDALPPLAWSPVRRPTRL